MTSTLRRVLLIPMGLLVAAAVACAQTPASAAPTPAAPAAPAAATPTPSAATPAPAAGGAYPEFPAGPGRAEFLRICSGCHTPDNVVGHGQDASGWTDTLNQMIQNGAQGSDQDFGAILEYLTKNVGPMPNKIDMNSVTSLDLQSWLGLSQQQASAVIAYRAAHGKFTSLADVEKVPGVSGSTLENFKSALTF